MGQNMIDIKVLIHQTGGIRRYSGKHLGMTAKRSEKNGVDRHSICISMSNKTPLSRCYLLRIGTMAVKPQLLTI